MGKIYILISGEYSDQTIITATTDEKKAMLLMKYIIDGSTYNDCRIEVVDDSIKINKDTKCFRVEHWFDENKTYIDNVELRFYVGTESVYHQFMSFYILAQDMTHAEKIAYDRIAKIKAERLGL